MTCSDLEVLIKNLVELAWITLSHFELPNYQLGTPYSPILVIHFAYGNKLFVWNEIGIL